MLDIYTLGLSSLVILVALALLAGGMWVSQRAVPGRAGWFLGHALTAAGCLTFAADRQMQTQLGGLLGYPLLFAGLLGLRGGLRLQLGLPLSPSRYAAVFLGYGALHGYLSSSASLALWRLWLVVTALVVGAGSLVYTVLTRVQRFGWAPCLLLALTLFAYVPLIAYRALVSHGGVALSPLRVSSLEAYLLIHITVAQILLCFAFEWLVSERLLSEQRTLLQDLSRKNEDLLQLATTDALTGAASRRHFLQTAAREQERALRYGYSLSLLMIDVDHFKRINDTHGHGAGDAALRALVTSLRSVLRESDCLGRLGGEEFAVLLPQTGLAGALEVAERLRQRVGALAVATSGGAELHLSVSIGAAEWLGRPQERASGEAASQESIDDFLQRADAALYRAKQHGRDRVELA